MGEMQNFVRFNDLGVEQLQGVIERGLDLKARWRAGQVTATLAGKTLAMLFDMPSTRTRVSFEAGMGQLGGTSLYINTETTQLVRQEPVADTARVIGSMTDIVVIRTYEHDMITEFAKHSNVPVVNGLSRLEHPCQVLADLMTLQEVHGPCTGKKVAWIGDCTNVCLSWMQAAAIFGLELAVATPPGHAGLPDGYAGLAGVSIGADPATAVEGATCVITDVWASMGEDKPLRDAASGAAYCVDAALLARAPADAIFMHCLPAHRGEEVSAEVIDGPQSVVWNEAENRMHVQKALLEFLLGAATIRERADG